MARESPPKSREYLQAVHFLFGLAVFFTAFGIFGYFFKIREVKEFAVIVDISSYDIEYNLFQWDNSERTGSTARVKKVGTTSCNVNVHKRGMTKDSLKRAMFNCVKNVTKPIENFQLFNATIFIYATELTRLLCARDVARCMEIFDAVADVMNAFEMRISASNFRPLSGYEEAAFGWISVNDFVQNLQTKNTPKLGAIDMKNYSLLISFDGPGPSLSNDTTSPLLSSDNYTVYGNDYLVTGVDLMCFGLAQFKSRTVAHLIKKSPSKKTLTHSCFPPTHRETVLTSSLESPCVSFDILPVRKEYQLVGTGSVGGCEDLIHDTLKGSSSLGTRLNLLAVKGMMKPFNKSFLAFSRLSEIPELLSFSGKDLIDLYQLGKKSCLISVSQTYYNTACLDILYSYHILVKELGFDPSKVSIGLGLKIETVTGSMVYNSKDIPARKSRAVLLLAGLLSVLFSAGVFFLFGLFMTYKRSKLLREKDGKL